MREISISLLCGGEVLGRDVVTESGELIIKSGTIIRKSYIKYLEDLNVEKVMIEEDNEIKFLVRLKENCQFYNTMVEEVKDGLEGYTHKKNRDIFKLFHQAEEFVEGIIENLETAEELPCQIDKSKNNLYEHSVRVALYSVISGYLMELPREDLYLLCKGAFIHDLGFRYIFVNCDNKELEELNPEESFEYKKHTIYGYTAIEEEKEIPDAIKNMILFHHERLDGKGYPLKQKDVPLLSQIVGICDSFDSHCSGFGYKMKSKEETLSHMKKVEWAGFDETVGENFIKTIEYLNRKKFF